MSTNNTQHSATTQQRCQSDLITVWPDPHFLLLSVWRINTNQDPFYIKTKNQTQAFSYYFPFYPSSFVSALMLMRVITFDHEIPAGWPAHSHITRHLQSVLWTESKNERGETREMRPGCRKNVSLCAAKILPKYNEHFWPWSCALHLHSGLWLR